MQNMRNKWDIDDEQKSHGPHGRLTTLNIKKEKKKKEQETLEWYINK